MPSPLQLPPTPPPGPLQPLSAPTPCFLSSRSGLALLAATRLPPHHHRRESLNLRCRLPRWTTGTPQHATRGDSAGEQHVHALIFHTGQDDAGSDASVERRRSEITAGNRPRQMKGPRRVWPASRKPMDRRGRGHTGSRRRSGQPHLPDPSTVDVGTHTLFIGHVESVINHDHIDPLVRVDGGLATLIR